MFPRSAVLGALPLVVVICGVLQADILKGRIKSVAGREITVAVEAEDGQTAEQTLRVSLSSRVTVDLRRSRVADLRPGFEVTVFTDRDGDVLRVAAVTRPEAPSGRIRPSARATNPAAPDGIDSSRERATRPRVARSPAAGDEPAASWSQFRGPNRDNISFEDGLLDRWPPKGPPLVWAARGLGAGYSTVSLDGGLVLTMGNVGPDESVLALDLDDGRIVWKTRIADATRLSAGNGPRSTPTIDGETLYALGGNGDLACLEIGTGRVVWQKDILNDFQARNIGWGICESVLIDGEKLICTPGGRRGTVVALDKRNGQTVWTCQTPGNHRAGYASPIVIEPGGLRQYVVFTSQAVIGVRAADGEGLWMDAAAANGTANCSTPVYFNQHVFAASGYGTGGALLRLTPRQRGGTTATRLYATKDMKNHHGGMVVVDGFLYGSNDPGVLTCLEMLSGKVAWRERSVGKGSVTCADGHIYLRSENGPVSLVEVNPREYVEKGRFNQPERSGANAWPHPVVAKGRLFLRDQDVLLCYDVRDASGG